jgi:hypothetical protein
LTLEEAARLAETDLARLGDDALLTEAGDAAQALNTIRAEGAAARLEVIRLEAIQAHAENRLRAAEHEQLRRAQAKLIVDGGPCQVPGCTRVAAHGRTCHAHRAADIEAAAVSPSVSP